MTRAFTYRHLACSSVVLMTLIALAPPVQATALSYAVSKTVNLPGNVRWDLLTYDESGHRLYIARGDHVDVLDPKTLGISGSITDVGGVHGVALVPALGKGFISNGKTASIAVFDTKSLKTTATIPAEDDADSIAYDAASQRIFTANGDAGNLTAIDPKTNKKIESIPLSGKPESAIADGKGKLFVNIEDKGMIDVVDTKKIKVLNRYDISKTCNEPTGLAIDAARERLFVGCRNQVMDVVDGKTGTLLSSLPIGAMNDATGYDAGRNLAFASNGDGTLTVVGADGPDSYKVVQNVPTKKGARTMALDPRSHNIYLVSAEIDHIDDPTPEHPHPRPQFKEDTFTVITVTSSSQK
jgi:YVTN family beta-propeller protein